MSALYWRMDFGSNVPKGFLLGVDLLIIGIVLFGLEWSLFRYATKLKDWTVQLLWFSLMLRFHKVMEFNSFLQQAWPCSVAATSLGPLEVRQARDNFWLHWTCSPHDWPKYLTKKSILKTFNSRSSFEWDMDSSFRNKRKKMVGQRSVEI